MLKNQKAFTLIELLVTMCVLAILLSLAVPNFQKQIANNRSLALADEFIGALSFARSEAIKRGQFVTLCPANDGATDCGSNWLNGWLVVIDTAATETAQPPVVADVSAILRRWEARSDDGSRASLSEARDFIRYTGTGSLAQVEGVAPAIITLSTDKCSGNAKKIISVLVSGMLTTTKAACP